MNVIKQYLGISTTASQSNDGAKPRRWLEDDSLDRQARYLAERICSGFQLHDRRQRDESVEAFFAVDRHQFAHLDDDRALEAARAFVDALWEKENNEKDFQVESQIN
jgi:hypothetical protein